MESIKQLRETLMIQEWDLHSRHHAKQKCAERFAKVCLPRPLHSACGCYN
jgi:hypothetical protein